MVFGCNKSEQEFHQGDSVQQEQPIQDSTQGNTMVPDQTGNTEQAFHEQSDQPNTDGASAPSEAVLTGDNDNKPSEPNSETDNDIIKDSSAEITAATQAIYDSLIALQPEFKNCYDKTLKEFGDSPRVDKAKWYIFDLGHPRYRYNIEYDEFGTVYYKEGFTYQVKRAPFYLPFLDSCIDSVIPKSFDIDFSHHVNSFTDGVQKFGRLKLVFKTNPAARTLSVHIEPNDSFPIGTEHPMVNEDDKARWINVNQHYTQWLSRRVVKKSSE